MQELHQQNKIIIVGLRQGGTPETAKAPVQHQSRLQ
jgi:hypothetical protein